jgi:hypothetical protein
MIFQSLGKQPSRLHGHADSFGNDGMSFAGGIADGEDAFLATWTNAGLNGTGGEPRTFEFSAIENRTKY